MTPERRTFQIEYRDEGAGTVQGYAAIFNRSTDLGYFTEEIAPGAFEGRLNDDVVWVFNHDSNQLLGRTSSGTVGLTIDERGLRYEGNLPDTTLGNDMRELLRRGDIVANSFAFTIADEKWEKRDGKNHRVIERIERLYDVSLVTNPAYKEAVVTDVRSIPEGIIPESIDHRKEILKLRNRLVKNFNL